MRVDARPLRRRNAAGCMQKGTVGYFRSPGAEEGPARQDFANRTADVYNMAGQSGTGAGMTDIQSRVEAVRQAAEALRAGKPVLRIAIDGRCGAGKTTLAACLQELWDCDVFHMDDFFLRPAQRTAERLREAGGNVDYERFLREVLDPLEEGRVFSYAAYDCKTRSMKPPVTVTPKPIRITEGSYSCHPALWDRYDLHVFLTVDPEEQLRRISLRNGADLRVFREKWIPMEEQYFSVCRIAERCELVLD